MSGKLPLIVWCWAVASAQVAIDAEHARRLEASMASGTEPLLGCDISKVEPALTYFLRVEAGYAAEVPLAQFRGAGHELSALIKLTPSEGSPTYFLRQHSLPDFAGGMARISGRFRTLDGMYRVAVAVFDEQWRSCRAEWQIRVKAEPGAPGSRTEPALDRLTILLHAASFNSSQSALDAGDVQMLTDAVASVLERLPARRVRLVAFNLAERKELLREAEFESGSVERLSKSLHQFRPGAVDVRTLAVPHGDIELVVGLLNRELEDGDPPGAIVFVGPPGKVSDRFSGKALRIDPKRVPRLVYIEFGVQAVETSVSRQVNIDGIAAASRRISVTTPQIASPRQAQLHEPAVDFNTIRFTVSALKGRTFLVWRPEDLGKALQEIGAALQKR